MTWNTTRTSLVVLAVSFLAASSAHAGMWNNLGRRFGLGWGDGYHAGNRPHVTGSDCQTCGTTDWTFDPSRTIVEPAGTQSWPPLAPQQTPLHRAEPKKADPKKAEPTKAVPSKAAPKTTDEQEPVSPSDRAARRW